MVANIHDPVLVHIIGRSSFKPFVVSTDIYSATPKEWHYHLQDIRCVLTNAQDRSWTLDIQLSASRSGTFDSIHKRRHAIKRSNWFVILVKASNLDARRQSPPSE